LKRLATITVLFTILGCGLDAYVVLSDRWPDGSIVMQLQLGSAGPLIDGRSSWNASAEDALAVWNNYSDRVKFRVVRDSTVAAADGNGANNVFFSSSIFGRSFGSGTLAVTTNWSRVSTGERIEADVVFNTAYSWNSYDGPLRSTAAGDPLIDLHRVALHEFGHVLGLNHPDQFGQSVQAIMNSSIGDVDRLQPDDIAGAAALYGGGGGTALTPPDAPGGLTTSASGSTVSLSWQAPTSGGPPAAYIIEAGSGPGLTNLASLSTGNTATTYSAGGVGAGRYYVRVRAANAAGTSPASNESLLIVGGACASPPGAPSGLNASVAGSTVSLLWNAAPGNPTTYIVEAGTAPGLTNLANNDLGSPTTSYVASGVGQGAYYVRMRARNACGTGPASNEVLLVVR